MTARVQLIVPCYNEAKRLRAQPFLQLVAANRDLAIVFVDDGSTDATGVMLADIASGGGERIVVQTLTRNVGKAEAVRQGIRSALEHDPEYVGYWDADLSTPLGSLQDFIDMLDVNPGIDIVMGARVKLLGRRIERRMMRHYTGRMFATAASLALGVAVYDTQCGAKLFRANDHVRKAFADPFRSQWVMDVEILDRYLQSVGRVEGAGRICEIPLHEWTDVAGSKLQLRHAPRALLDLLSIARRRSG